MHPITASPKRTAEHWAIRKQVPVTFSTVCAFPLRNSARLHRSAATIQLPSPVKIPVQYREAQQVSAAAALKDATDNVKPKSGFIEKSCKNGCFAREIPLKNAGICKKTDNTVYFRSPGTLPSVFFRGRRITGFYCANRYIIKSVG